MRHYLSRVMVFLAVLLLMADGVKLLAQADTGTILGTVRDQTGAVVPGAKVTITNEGTGLTTSKTTATDGSYLFTPIKIGIYRITAEYKGFRTAERTHVTVDIQQHVLVDFSLSPGLVTQTVEVTTPPPLLETQSGSLGQVIESKAITDLPLNGRNFTFLAQLSAGVIPNYIAGAAASGTTTGGFIANGFRFEQDNFMLDGLDNNNKMTGYGYTGPTVALPPVDAIQEFKLQTNGYSAQFGRSASALMNATTKSGTNRIHGALWEFVRNADLDSADFFQDAAGIKKGKYQRNQFGGAVGGPVYFPHIYDGRNKTFFFFDYEGTRIRQAVPVTTSVPTVAEESSGYTNYADLITGESGALYGPDGLGRKYAIGTILDPATTRGPFNAGQVDPVTGLTFTSSCSACYVRDPFPGNIMPANRIFSGAAKIAAMDPLPNIPNAGLFNNYAANLPLTLNNDLYDIRADQNFSSRDQFFARYSHFHSPQMVPSTNGGNVMDLTTVLANMHSGVAGWTHTFTPTLINEARVGYSRLYGATLQQNASNYGLPASLGIPGIPQGNLNGGVPAMLISTAITTLWVGDGTQTPDVEYSETTQVGDNLTKISGKHTLKAGFLYMHMAFPFTTDTFGRGRWRFNGAFTSIVGIGDSSTGWANFLLQPIPSMLPAGDSGVDYSGGSTGITISNVAPIATSQGYYGLYFQDDWKVTPKLTLNLGLREEYFPGYQDKFGAMANIVPNLGWQGGQFLMPTARASSTLSTSFLTALANDNIKVVSDSNPALVNVPSTNWGPRFGFAYSATPKFVVRGGFGLFHGGADNQGSAPNLAGNYPFLYTLGYNPPNSVQPIAPGAAVGALSNGFNSVGLTATTVTASAVSPRGITPFYKIPTAYEGNLTLQYQLTPNTVASLGYVETSGRHLDSVTEANLANVLLPPTTSNLLPYVPFPDLSRGFFYVTTQADSYYNGMQINLERRFSGGLNFLANYTYSKCRNDGGGTLYGESENYYRAPYVPGFGIQYDYTLCDWDTTNILHFSGSWSLPVGAGRRFLGNSHGVVNKVIGGWQTNWIFTWTSGQPTTIHSATSTDAGQAATANAFLVPGQNPDAGQSLAHYWNAAAFATPPLVTTVGQTNGAPLGGKPDQVYGPPVHRIDFSLFKQFHITEKTYLEFRGEFFNFTNTPDFGMPSATNYLNTTNFGQITSTRDSPNDARQIQLGVKLYF